MRAAERERERERGGALSLSMLTTRSYEGAREEGEADATRQKCERERPSFIALTVGRARVRAARTPVQHVTSVLPRWRCAFERCIGENDSNKKTKRCGGLSLALSLSLSLSLSLRENRTSRGAQLSRSGSRIRIDRSSFQLFFFSAALHSFGALQSFRVIKRE